MPHFECGAIDHSATSPRWRSIGAIGLIHGSTRDDKGLRNFPPACGRRWPPRDDPATPASIAPGSAPAGLSGFQPGRRARRMPADGIRPTGRRRSARSGQAKDLDPTLARSARRLRGPQSETAGSPRRRIRHPSGPSLPPGREQPASTDSSAPDMPTPDDCAIWPEPLDPTLARSARRVARMGTATSGCPSTVTPPSPRSV